MAQNGTGSGNKTSSPPDGRDVLILSRDVIGDQVAGPGVRYLEMARRLAARHRVTLLAPGLETATAGSRLRTGPLTRGRLKPEISRCAVVISQGFACGAWTTATTAAAQVFDLYAPLQLEMLEAGQAGHGSAAEAAFYRRYVARRLRLLMAHGDFFICASERQRDLWLGALALAGRINRATHARDAGLRGLIDCVPFGTPTEPFPRTGTPAETRIRARRSIGGVADDDFLLLWGGGVWPWLDARTAIRAAARAAEQRPGVKLLFLGSGHPNPGVTTGREAAEQARSFAAEIGALGRTVLFNDQWVPFDQRVDFLAAADAGLLAHRPGIESRFAFRTRLLDCFWAGLPVISTAGDELSSLVRHKGAGLVVPPEDPAALAEAIIALAVNFERRAAAAKASEQLGERYRWDRVFGPLEQFVDRPHTRRTGGERIPGGGRWGAVRYSAAVAALGVRHGLWRRALSKVFTGSRT